MKPALGVVLAAVATFMFGFIYWAALDMPGKALKNFDDDDAVRAALTDLIDESGTYMYPDAELYKADEEAYNAAYAAGPRAMIHIMESGRPAMDATQLATGFLRDLVTWALVAVVLSMTAPALRSYGSRVIAIALTGVAVSVWIYGGELNWFPIGLDWTVVTGVDNAISWLLAGLVLAAFIKPKGT